MSLETVRRAILLGSVRKSMSLIDHLESEPVRSLRYFAGRLEEVRQERMSAGYWQHLESALERCERYWRQGSARVTGRAYSDLEQGIPSEERPEPSSAGEQEQGEDEMMMIFHSGILALVGSSAE